MKIIFISNDGYDDSELLYPYYRLIEENYDIEIAAPESRVIEGKYFFKIPVDKKLSEINADDYDALLLPGGKAPEKLRLLPEVLNMVRRFAACNKPIAAICHGQQILISAGILSGITATCYPGICDDLKNAGANYIDSKVVLDGNMVTSRRPEDLPYFMRAFIKVLREMK